MPKVFLTVFVASRIAALADKDQRAEMDLTTKLLNYGSVAVGILLGIGTGWYVDHLILCIHALMSQIGLSTGSRSKRSENCQSFREKLTRLLQMRCEMQKKVHHCCATFRQNLRMMSPYHLSEVDGNSTHRRKTHDEYYKHTSINLFWDREQLFTIRCIIINTS